MNINVAGKHLPHDHEIRGVAHSRVAGLKQYYGEGLIDAAVVLNTQAGLSSAEVRVHTSDGHVFVAKEDDRDVWGAFDKAYEHVKRQLIRHKKQIRNHHADKRALLGLSGAAAAEETRKGKGSEIDASEPE